MEFDRVGDFPFERYKDREIWETCEQFWSRRTGSNRQQADYKSATLPLSYDGIWWNICDLNTGLSAYETEALTAELMFQIATHLRREPCMRQSGHGSVLFSPSRLSHIPLGYRSFRYLAFGTNHRSPSSCGVNVLQDLGKLLLVLCSRIIY